MINITTWRKLRSKVARIRCLYLQELIRLGMRLRLRTLGRLFEAKKVTLE